MIKNRESRSNYECIFRGYHHNLLWKDVRQKTMVSTRKSARSNSMAESKQQNSESVTTKPLKPVPKPSSITQVFLMIGLELCKKLVFGNTYIRILFYLTSLFALSGIADLMEIPKFYLSSSNNILNLYFVKIGWFWTLFLSVPFVCMTSYTYCCGKKNMMYRHLIRLAIATFFWYFWVNFFVYVEKMYGFCVNQKNLKTKMSCVSHGSRWHGLDLSGHAFILIYSTLVLIEEAKPILGWESLRDIIREETYTRGNSITNYGALRNLTKQEFEVLSKYYKQFLPYIRSYFVAITFLTIIWDIMLIITILYFHSMPEKLISGIIAILTWYLTYRQWYTFKFLSPLSPCDGVFIYYKKNAKADPKSNTPLIRKNSVSTFMGMPLNVPNEK